MGTYVLRRFLHSIVTLVGVSLVVFGILRVLPGDPAKMVLPEGASAAQVEQMRRQLGLLEPLYVQYGVFVSSVVRGDFGQSFQFHAPVTSVIAERIWPTVHLASGRVHPDGQPGCAGRNRRGGPAPDAVRLRQHLPGGARPVLTELLARHHDDPALWGGARLAPDVRLSGAELSGAAGHHAGSLPGSVGRTANPFEHAGGADQGVRSNGAQQGTARTSRGHPPRFEATPRFRSSRVLGLQIGVLLSGAVITESVFAWPGLGQAGRGQHLSARLPRHSGDL